MNAIIRSGDMYVLFTWRDEDINRYFFLREEAINNFYWKDSEFPISEGMMIGDENE